MNRKQQFCDLHSHSTTSDGTLTPEELACHASEVGLNALALTDHDTTKGLDRCRKACENVGVAFIEGIEVSCAPESIPGINDHREQLKRQHLKKSGQETPSDYKTEDGLPPLGVLHILGLFVDSESEALDQISQMMVNARDKRNPSMIEKLQQLGLSITMDDLNQLARDQAVAVLSRPHIGQILVEKGYARDIDDAFEKYLKRGRPGYVPRQMIHIKDAIDAIHEAGGVAILAHPPQLRLGVRDILFKTLESLRNIGLDGIEVWHPCHTGPQSVSIEQIGRELAMQLSGGSDFHGHRKKIALGSQNVPFEILERLKTYQVQKYALKSE